MDSETDRPVRVGLIGFGFAGKDLHFPHLLRNRRCQLVCVADPNSEKLSAISASYSKSIDVTTDCSALLSRDDLDAVIIATPTGTHLELLRSALERGLHVLVEKPLALNMDTASEMVRLSESADKLVMVGQVLRYWDDYVQARNMVNYGRIGVPKIARTYRGVRMPKGWYAQDELSGGVVLDLALHDIDFLVWTLGSVQSVFAQGTVHGAEGAVPFVDYVQLHLNFESGAIAHVEAAWVHSDAYPFSTSLEISGTEGILSIDNSPGRASLEVVDGASVSASTPVDLNGYYFQQDAFFKAIQTQGRSPVPPSAVIHPLAVALAARNSVRSGEVVMVAAT